MLEIIFLYALCSFLGRSVRKTGRDPGPAQFLLVGLWFCGEIVGALAGSAIGHTFGVELAGTRWLLPYIGAWVGAILGLVISFHVGKRYAIPEWVPLGVLSVPISFVIALAVILPLTPSSWGTVRLVLLFCAWVLLVPGTYFTLKGFDWLFERVIENNYKTLLIGRYLRRRRIAWVSLVAVMLCTMMVLVVISVMGGWLNMFEHSFQGLTGDIIIESSSLAGFPYYQEMIDGIQRQPGIEAAVPTIETFGIMNAGNQITRGVQVQGIPIDQIGKVNRFPESLYLQYRRYIDAAKETDDPAKKKELMAQAEQHAAHPSFKLPLPPQVYRDDSSLRNVKTDPAQFPGIIPGSGTIGIRRNSKGETEGREPIIYQVPVKLTTIAIHPGQMGINPNDKNETIYWIVDDSHTGLWQADNNSVYVPFDELQKDLQMAPTEEVDIDTGKKTMTPARTSQIQIRVKPGYDLDKARDEVLSVVQGVVAFHLQHGNWDYPHPQVQTWREKQRVWIDAVSNEKLLTVILFGIISIVAIFLVFCIFYMIVMEKTKDIGIIKSVGATSSGVAGIFLGYGLVIGLVGSLMGLLCSFLIVHYINQLHSMIARLFGFQIWNPEVYLFDKIPNTMSWRDIAVIVPIAIISSVLGALVPAIRAAQMHPVESLRWE